MAAPVRSVASGLAWRYRARAVGVAFATSALLGLLWPASAAEAEAAVATRPPAGHPRGGLARPAGIGDLHFEPNVGQLDDGVRFVARAPGYGIELLDDRVRLGFVTDRSHSDVVELQVVGARRVEPIGLGEAEGRSNYFVGDRSRWRADVAGFARVRYPGVRDGVELEIYASLAGELEYDLVLAPSVDPGSVEVELRGLRSLELDASGDAILGLPDGGVLRKRAPVAYQLDAAGRRRPVASRFRLSGARLGFVVGDYDTSRPLVIDPALSYSSYLGGSRFDEFFSVAADSSGNLYAVGYTTGSLFPVHAATQGGFAGGASDAVICKLNAAGTNFVYSTYLGGGGADQAYGVAVDGVGNAYVTGVTYSSNFPTVAARQATHGGGLQDGFVAKLGPTGTLLYSTYLGGNGDDLGRGIAVRSTGQAYVTGVTFSWNFPTLAPLQASLAGTSDAFVSVLSATGALTYSTYLGGSGGDYGHGIAVQSSDGTAVVVGETGSGNFPTQAPAQAAYGGALTDAFVSRLSSTGASLIYSTYLGGASPDSAWAVAQAAGLAVVVGSTSSFNFPTLGAAQATQGGSGDAFVTRLGSTGNLMTSTYLGGSASDWASGVYLDALGFSYVVGQTGSTNFPVQNPLPGGSSLAGGSDAFLSAFAANGERMYTSYLGGGANDAAAAITGPGTNQLYVVGNTLSADFPTQSGALFGTALGPQDGFLVKLTRLELTPAPWGNARTAAWLGLLLLGSGLVLLSFRRHPASS
jgi:hypothetical protein